MNESNAILKARQASLENILFSVEQVPLDHQRKILVGHQFANQYSSVIYCPSMNKILHMAGSKYQLVTNEQLIMLIYEKIKVMFGESGFTVKCRNEDDRRFSAQFILTDKIIKVANNDILNAMIEIQNSYDGSLQQLNGTIILSSSLYQWHDGLEKRQRDNPTARQRFFN